MAVVPGDISSMHVELESPEGLQQGCYGCAGGWQRLRLLSICTLVAHGAHVVFTLDLSEAVWAGILLLVLVGKLAMAALVLVASGLARMRRVQGQRLQELYTLTGVVSLLYGGMSTSKGLLELQRPEPNLERGLLSLFFAVQEFLCCACAFTARQRSPVAPENPDDSEEVQKQMAEEWQWHFLLQLTYYSYETCPSVQEEAVCPICLEKLEDQEEVAQPRCTHLYHRECLEEWVIALSHLALCGKRDQVLCPLRCESAKVSLFQRSGLATPNSSITGSTLRVAPEWESLR